MTHNAPTPVSSTDAIRRAETSISETRKDLSKTLAELTNHVKPSELRGVLGTELEHAETRVRTAVREELSHARGLVHEELEQVEQKVRQGVIDAREGLKAEVKAAFTGAKKDLRAATLGRVETLATQVGDTMNETSDSLMESVRRNPIPAAMMGVGLAWWLMGRSKNAKTRNSSQGQSFGQGPYDGGISQQNNALNQAATAANTGLQQAGDAVGNAVHDARAFAGKAAADVSGKASDLAHKASDAATHFAHDIKDAASSAAGGISHAATAVGKSVGSAAVSVGEGARTGAKKVGEAYTGTMRDNPLVLGGAAVAIGVAIGLALPRTHGEDKVLGPLRDQMLSKAGDVVQDAADGVTHLAERTYDAASSALETTRPSAPTF
ncbi:MAG: hypothetical protein Q8S33_01835 [Myxococcales bacterium]|nr:hypothetical protein [Myxococcales bacterium]